MNGSILKKAYGKAYEVMDVTTQDFCKFLLITNIKSHERIFSPFALLVTSISFLQVEFIIKAMLGAKNNSAPLPNKFQGIGSVYMLQILDASVKILEKLWAVLKIQKKTQLGGLGWVKVRFKVLHFTNTNISFLCLLHFSTLQEGF